MSVALATTAGASPFDLAATRRLDGWRDSLVWPVEQDTLRRAAARPLHRLVEEIGGLSGDARDPLLLAGGALLAYGRAVVETALAAMAAERRGLVLVTDDRLFTYLSAGGDPPADLGLPGADALRAAPVSWPAARRLRRIASWSPPWRLAGNTLSPQAVAITHNPLLISEARRGRLRVGYRHAATIFAAARRGGAAAPAAVDPALVAMAADLVVADSGLDEPWHDRARAMILRLAESWLAGAVRDLAALRALPRLPEHVLSGTGGNWQSRAIGIAVLRRDGQVTRFDHGGPTALIADDAPVAFTEFTAASAFTLPSAAHVPLVDAGATRCRLARWRPCALHGGNGDPEFRAVPLLAPPRRVRPRVVYAPTILRGQRQFHRALLPDPIYLDWQLWLAETLARLPIDLICKPHPGGLLKGQAHPLAQVAPTSRAPFETLMADSDLFVFDFAESTTFWAALCSNRPVVLLDLGIARFTPTAERLLAERCLTLSATYDERGRPRVDPEALAEAILGMPREADPSGFRAFLAGDPA